MTAQTPVNRGTGFIETEILCAFIARDNTTLYFLLDYLTYDQAEEILDQVEDLAEEITAYLHERES